MARGHREQRRRSTWPRSSTIPQVSSVWKWVGWAIPAIILGSIGYIGWTQGFGEASDNALYWFLANAIPTGIGGLVLALAHPTTVGGGLLRRALHEPDASDRRGLRGGLRPDLGAPTDGARDSSTVGEDIATWRGWWNNALLKIFLVFILTTLGSVIGTWVGGIEIVKNVLS